MHRIRFRPILRIREWEGITTTPQDIKSDPYLGKYRSEHGLFNEAPEYLVNDDIIGFHDTPMTKTDQTDEMHHTIRGVITTPATTEPHALAGTAESAAFIRGTDMVPPFSLQPRTRIRKNHAIVRRSVS